MEFGVKSENLTTAYLSLVTHHGVSCCSFQRQSWVGAHIHDSPLILRSALDSAALHVHQVTGLVQTSRGAVRSHSGLNA